MNCDKTRNSSALLQLLRLADLLEGLALGHGDLLHDQDALLPLYLVDQDDVIDGHLGLEEEEGVLGADEEVHEVGAVAHPGDHLAAPHLAAQVLQPEGRGQGLAVSDVVVEDVGGDGGAAGGHGGQAAGVGGALGAGGAGAQWARSGGMKHIFTFVSLELL